MDKRAVAAAFRERLQAPARRRARRRRGIPARNRHRPLGAQPVPRSSDRPDAARRNAAADRGGARRHSRLAAKPVERARRSAGGDAVGSDRVGRGPRRRIADRSVAPRGRRHEAALRARRACPTCSASPRRSPSRTARALAGQPEKVLGGFRLGEMDVEIAMPVQTLQDLAQGTGLWRGVDPPCAAASSRTWRRPAPRPTRRCACTSTTAAPPSPRPSPSSAASAPRSISARPISSSPRPSRSAALSRLFDNLVRRADHRPGPGAGHALRLADATA